MVPAESESPLDPFSRIVLNPKACFLCGATESLTEEHLFPKWLQNKYDLWNQRLGLLNRTTIKYSQLKVECCTTCNTKHLSQLEIKIQNAVADGYKACINLDPIDVFQWLGKIFFGILRKELTLKQDRADPESGSIVSAREIEEFNALHDFLQSIRLDTEFVSDVPFSAFVVNLFDLGGAATYHFRDSAQALTASIRLGDVGFLVAFEDAGLNRNTYGRYVEEVGGRKLHPLQFEELYAKITYQVTRLNRPIKYVSVSSENQAAPRQIITFPPGPPLLDWDRRQFAGLLGQVVIDWLELAGLTTEDLYQEPGLVVTWMSDADDNLFFFDEELKRIGWQSDSSA